MPKVKRLRMFAGPNGSGKSTLFEAFKKNFKPGFFINSDLIEKEIHERGYINLEQYNLTLTQKDWEKFCKKENAQSLFTKSQKDGYEIDVAIKENIIVSKSKNTHSYEASLITSFLREKMMETNQSFSFETVMSHVSKLDELVAAKEQGYKTYFYFICLDDPDLNISRIEDRVEKGGHNVDSQKVADRYSRTLENLLPAMKLADQCYLFDNSEEMKLVAESKDGNITILLDEKDLPNWFINYVINKL